MSETTETIECGQCGCEVDLEESYSAKVGEKGNWQDVCQDCYREIVETCQLCGEEDVMPSDVSEFILIKAEFSRTASRPPGIYRVLNYPFMSCGMLGGGHLCSYDILFIDKLPKFDEHYEISGHICKKCSHPYAETQRKVYGHRSLKKLREWDKKGWELQRAHTRATILANPDMLRDLECDPTDEDAAGHHISYANARDWHDLKELYDLPDGLPTYHEWVFVEHKGVKVYYAGYKSASSWMTLHPEPRFRTNGHGLGAFACSDLPTYARHHLGREYDYYGARELAAKPAVIDAINLGAITQEGISPSDSPIWNLLSHETLA